MATYEANSYVGDAQQAPGALGLADLASEQTQADGEAFWSLVFSFDAQDERENVDHLRYQAERTGDRPYQFLTRVFKALGSRRSKRRALALSDPPAGYALTPPDSLWTFAAYPNSDWQLR